MKLLIKYADKRFKSLHVHLDKYKQCVGIEDLHQIRVELKKIKTLFDLITHDFKKSEYKPLKNIFKNAGRIRETDVLHQLFRKYKLQQFEKSIKREALERKSAIAAFRQKAKYYKKAVNHIQQRSKKYLIEINRGNLNKYVFKVEQKINKKLFSKYRLDELHKIRKQIKKIIYLSQVTDSKDISKKNKLYDNLQNIIGQWHDKNVLIRLLQKNKGHSHKTVLGNLKLECNRDIKSIKSLIIKIKKSCL